MLSSGLTNFVGLLIGHPFETIKVYIQTKTKFPGIKALYKGFTMPLITYIPYYTMTFTFTQ